MARIGIYLGGGEVRAAGVGPCPLDFPVRRLLGRTYDHPDVQRLSVSDGPGIVQSDDTPPAAWLEFGANRLSPSEFLAAALSALELSAEAELGDAVAAPDVTVAAWVEDEQRLCGYFRRH